MLIKKIYIDAPVIKIPNTYTYITSWYFSNYTKLTDIVLPTTLKNIGEHCFSMCSNLESIIIPDSVTSIGKNCFYGCRKLSSVILSSNIVRIPYYAFAECNIKTIYIPDKCRYIHKQSLVYNPLESIYCNNPKLIKCRKNIIKPYNEEEFISKTRIKLDNNKILNELMICSKQIDLNKFTLELQNLFVDVNNFEANNCRELETKVKQINDICNKISIHQEQLQTINDGITKIYQELSYFRDCFKNKIDNLTRYELPKLNTIQDKLNKIILFEEDDNFNTTTRINERYYYYKNLIIPNIINPYTEIYELPIEFTKINMENKKILSNAKIKIALLPIEYKNETIIDLSQYTIDYLIDTFKNIPSKIKKIKPNNAIELHFLVINDDDFDFSSDFSSEDY